MLLQNLISSVETTSSGTKYRKIFFLKRSRDSDNGFVISVLENSESRHNLKTRFRDRNHLLIQGGVELKVARVHRFM